ncbi:MAG TPA: zf-HC2 domain-containing protein [Gemmatimonadales bacterium]|jgi:hypothetical protein
MTEHLTVDEVALHLEGRLPGADQSRVDRHLTECAECRAELVALSRVLRRNRGRRRWLTPAAALAVAAAAVLLFIIIPSTPEPSYREPAVSTTPAPVAITPRGPSRGVTRLVWTRVPHADRYRLTVFDSSGTVVSESQTTDTSAAMPVLHSGTRYFWQVEAETGFHRSIKSDVIEFVFLK